MPCQCCRGNMSRLRSCIPEKSSSHDRGTQVQGPVRELVNDLDRKLGILPSPCQNQLCETSSAANVHLLSPDYWAGMRTPSECGSKASGAMFGITLAADKSQETHWRRNPSGAIILLTIGRTAAGPIEAETPAERTARKKTRERGCDIARRMPVMRRTRLIAWGSPRVRHLIQKAWLVTEAPAFDTDSRSEDKEQELLSACPRLITTVDCYGSQSRPMFAFFGEIIPCIRSSRLRAELSHSP
jgi:hypothetical protein